MADDDIALIQNEARAGMEKALRSLKAELQKIRTGRANVALLDGIQVDYYGTPTPLNQLANLTTPDRIHSYPAAQCAEYGQKRFIEMRRNRNRPLCQPAYPQETHAHGSWRLTAVGCRACFAWA